MQETASHVAFIVGQGSEWFWVMLQFLVITATLILIYLQVRLQTATHIVSTLTTIHNRWNSKDMLRARYIYCQSWLSGAREFDAVAEYIAGFLEEMGQYVKMGAVPKSVMWEAHSWYIEYYYDMFKDGLQEVRHRHKDATLYMNFERLFVAMDRISRRKGSPTGEKQEEQLMEFALDEIKMAEKFLKLKISEEQSKKTLDLALQTDNSENCTLG